MSRAAKCGVPSRYAACDRGSWSPSPDSYPWPDLDRWLTDAKRPWAVVFIGPTGSGKSHIATALLMEWISSGERFAWWVDAAEAIHGLREDLARQPEAIGITMREKLHADRLVLIDDFLAERMTDFAHSEWLYALTQRYNHERPTIFTTNADSLESFDALDPRVTSRLGDGLVVRLSGRDRRTA